MIKLPTFPHRQIYETSVDTIEDVRRLLLDVDACDGLYYRGMSRYEVEKDRLAKTFTEELIFGFDRSDEF